MNIKENIKACLDILNITPEDWLEFSAGQNTDTNLKRFKNRNIVYSSIRQVFGYLKLIFLHFKVKKSLFEKNDILFFAVTPNQYNVLSPIAKELKGLEYVFMTSKTLEKRMIATGVNSEHIEIGLKQLLLLCILHVTRLKALYRMYERKPKLFYFRGKSIISVHFWLVFHLNFLNEIRPKLVLVANDHNAETRSLIESCKMMKIPIAYVQHAEVSPRFHSLDFNISFLYGQHSLEIYKRCESRRSVLSSPPKERYYSLVGSMRPIFQENYERKKTRNKNLRLGLLIKGTDDVSDIVDYVNHLSQYGEVIIRPHPNMKFEKLVSELYKLSRGKVLYSDPRTQNPADFLSNVNVVISGNSTMLLEAAIAGVLPIYVENMSAGVLDYYGFVKNSIAMLSESVFSISEAHLKKSQIYKCDSVAIQYYINTFGGPMYRSEPKFVSQQIVEYLQGNVGNLSELQV